MRVHLATSVWLERQGLHADVMRRLTTSLSFFFPLSQALVDVYLGAREELPELSQLTTAQVVEAYLDPQLRAARSSCVWQMLKAPTRPPAYAVLHCPAASFQGLVRSLQVYIPSPRSPQPLRVQERPGGRGRGNWESGGSDRPGRRLFLWGWLRVYPAPTIDQHHTHHTSLGSSGVQAPPATLERPAAVGRRRAPFD